MIKTEDLRGVIEQYLQGTDIFVVDIRIKPGNNITILLDKDSGITIDDCVALNRHIESNFDREVEDYNLTVASAGVGQPFKLLRQYIKNLGKVVEVELTEGQALKGVLAAANEENITLRLSTKVKKEIIEEDKVIPFSIIKSVKEVISFR